MTHTVKATNIRSVGPGAITTPNPLIQSTIINVRRVINVAVYSESKMAHKVKLYTAPTASNNNNNFGQ